jgi:hypothetical protein
MRYLIFLIVSNRVLTLVVTNKRGNMSEAIKKIGIPTLVVASALLLMGPMLLTGAYAAPRLHAPIDCDIVGENQLQCIADVSGLGGAETADAILRATATVTTGCITPSGSNEPKGLQRTSVAVTDFQTVNVEGGRAVFTLTTDPLDAEELRDCPSANMTPTIVCVTFSGISVQVIPSSGPSRTFNVAGTLSNC